MILSRRQAVQRLGGAGAAMFVGLQTPASAEEPAPAGPPKRPTDGATVRDRLWVWAHAVGSYDNAWGLPGNSRVTPLEGAQYLGVPNLIMIRYGGKPAPPFEAYAAAFKPLKRVFWSVTGAGGATSQEEREHVFRLAAKMPNIVGVFMGDFFHGGESEPPQWLAANSPRFPVMLTLRLAEPAAGTRLELTQSAWRTGDYRTATFAVDLPEAAGGWREVGQGTLPNQAEAKVSVDLPGQAVGAIRIRLLGTHDTKDALGCGLRRVRLFAGDREVALAKAKVEASSTYAGFDPQAVVRAEAPDTRPAPAALSPDQLRAIRERLRIGVRRLDLGVTLYTHQLSPRIGQHLDLCDVVSLWTWKAQDLRHLEASFAKFRQLAPAKRVLLGCYMWDFGTNKPMPLDLMKKQTELGLKWLRAGQVEGLIFLATNVCGLNLETVEWTRRWIAQVGDQRL